MRYLARHADHSGIGIVTKEPSGLKTQPRLTLSCPHRHPNKGAGGEWSNGNNGALFKVFLFVPIKRAIGIVDPWRAGLAIPAVDLAPLLLGKASPSSASVRCHRWLLCARLCFRRWCELPE